MNLIYQILPRADNLQMMPAMTIPFPVHERKLSSSRAGTPGGSAANVWDDNSIVEAVGHGDEQAFRRLVEEHLDSVTRTVTGLLGNTADVDDVVQEVFVKLHAHLGTFRGDASLRTFVTRIAINRSLDVLRVRKRRRWLQSWGTSADLEAAGGSVEAIDLPAESDQAAVLRRALNTLPESQRIVVLLRLVEELSTEETANVLGIKYGTVLSRLKRGMDALKTELSGDARTSLTEDT